MVHIRKVDIYGFKSFGFKNTTVNFEPGLISISGPNGSGKSNILDAIVFALGENKPTVMRAPKLRELIHDIASERKTGHKMARVTVHLDNSDRKIPIDSDAFSVTRVMAESGESEYFLDKKKIQRNRVRELFEIAHADLNQLNNVQQGTVMRIAEFSAEEKRDIIEQLIGLKSFDEKKKEAQIQLEKAENETRVALARMGEIKKSVDDLEVDRNKKLRHDLLSYEISRLRAIEAANKLKTINSTKLSKERNLHALQSEMKKFDEERSQLRKEIHQIESEKKKIMEAANAYTKAKADNDRELSQAFQASEQLKNELTIGTKRLNYIETRLPEIKSTLEQLHIGREPLEKQISELKQSIQLTKNEQRKITEDLHAFDSEYQKIVRQQNHVTSQKREVDNKIKHLTQKSHAATLLLAKLDSEKTDTQNKINLNNTKSEELKSNIQRFQQLIGKLHSSSHNHKATIDEIKSRISKIDNKKIKIENDIEEVSTILEKSTQALAQFEAKIKIVKNIMHEDYSIAKLKEDAGKLGIEGLAYELLSWDKKYERAMLAVSSDWIKSLVVNDFATLLSISEIARTKKLPKLKIIPLEAIPKFNLTLPKDENVIGILSNFVKCDKKYAPLKTFLFGNVVLVDSKDTAYRISKSGYKTVTIDGEFFEAKASAVVVDINSKISKLTKVISMSTSVEGLSQSIQMLKKFMTRKKNAYKKVDGYLQNYRDRLSLSEKEMASSNSDYSGLKERMISSQKTIKQIESRNTQLQRKLERLDTEWTKQESFAASLKERIKLVQDNYADPEQSRLLNEISRVGEKKTSLLQKQTSTVSTLREKESSLVSLVASEDSEKSKMRSLNEEHAKLNHEKNELEVNLRRMQKEKDGNEQVLVTLRDKEQELISTSGNSIDMVNEFDEKLRDLGSKEHSISKEIHGIERQSDALTRDLKDLSENVNSIQKTLDDYGFSDDIETFEVESLLQPLISEQKNLADKINAVAPARYIEISNGYRSMSTRKNELEEERNSIVRFIEEIEKDKRQTFLDGFDIVAKEAEEIFSKMTGGTARLELQNEDDIFNSGLSYVIQFPNKPKRESTSISGGEKTLAAIVFVLALQKLQPSPFYLFDEVDAHLDGPNAEKLSKIIKERSEGSQFIMVSLKDSVVEKAKLIYGVFPKGGVSNVVTYKDKRLPSMTN